MQVEHHDLHHEFPEFTARIHYLKVSNSRFAKLFSQYDIQEHEIRRIENGGSLISDSELEAMKSNRLKLKDMLYGMLAEPV
jgi:uncharacterized protein YdcH (DUF465 family)